MSLLQKISAALLLLLLAAAGYGLWETRPPTSSTPVGALTATPQAESSTSGSIPAIDESTLLTAQRLARLATTPEAVQLADHELDLSFAGALRHLEAHPPTLSAAALAIQDRLTQAQQQLESDTARAKQLTDALAKSPDGAKAGIQDELDLAQAQQELDQDEVTQANEDLVQAGGNVHQRIQMMQQEHEAAEHQRQAAAAEANPLGNLKGLVGKVRQWLALHRKRRWLGRAQQHALDSAAQLESQSRQIAADLAAR